MSGLSRNAEQREPFLKKGRIRERREIAPKNHPDPLARSLSLTFFYILPQIKELDRTSHGKESLILDRGEFFSKGDDVNLVKKKEIAKSFYTVVYSLTHVTHTHTRAFNPAGERMK